MIHEEYKVLALKALVIGMGILIVAGVAVLGFALANRMSSAGAPIASVLLEEPAGTRIVGSALAQDRMALQLGGGGPDRIVLVDTKVGRVLGRVQLLPKQEVP